MSVSELKTGIISIDKQGFIRFIDTSAKEILNLNSDANYVSQPFLEVVSGSVIQELYNESLSIERVTSREFIPDWDSRKTLYVKAEPFSINEESGLIVQVSDLSKLRRLETLQKDFVANVSHELRTPLTSIKMAAESLQMGGFDHEKARDRFLSNIQREADRLTRLVNELLVLANLDSKVTLHTSKFDPKEMFSDIVTAMNYHADLNDITLEADFPDNFKMIEVDKDRVHQVLINLTDNAIKCNRKNGKVTLFVRQDDENIVIKIIDTGIGIQKIDLPRIFDRFFRVDRSRSRVTGGSGLGLSIVKDIIVAHGGDITVDSEINVGTEFTIKLPLVSVNS